MPVRAVHACFIAALRPAVICHSFLQPSVSLTAAPYLQLNVNMWANAVNLRRLSVRQRRAAAPPAALCSAFDLKRPGGGAAELDLAPAADARWPDARRLLAPHSHIDASCRGSGVEEVGGAQSKGAAQCTKRLLDAVDLRGPRGGLGELGGGWGGRTSPGPLQH